MKKENRITTNEFKLIKKAKYPKKQSNSNLFYLNYYKSNEILNPKIAFIVRKKDVKLAVNRNKIKRLSRDIVRKKLNGINNGCYIFTLKSLSEEGFEKLNYEKVNFNINKNLSKIF